MVQGKKCEGASGERSGGGFPPQDLRLIDFVNHSTLGLREIKKKKFSRLRMQVASKKWDCRTRKVDIRLPGKGNSNCHGARPVHLIITMIKWIRTSRWSIKNSLSLGLSGL